MPSAGWYKIHLVFQQFGIFIAVTCLYANFSDSLGTWLTSPCALAAESKNTISSFKSDPDRKKCRKNKLSDL